MSPEHGAAPAGGTGADIAIDEEQAPPTVSIDDRDVDVAGEDPRERVTPVDVTPLWVALKADAPRTRRQRRLDRAAELMTWFRCTPTTPCRWHR
jgi:hypothetical protein